MSVTIREPSPDDCVDVAEFSQEWYWETDERDIVSVLSKQYGALTKTRRSDVIGLPLRSVIEPTAIQSSNDYADIIGSMAARVKFTAKVCNFNAGRGRFFVVRWTGKPRFDQAGIFKIFTEILWWTAFDC